MVLSLNFSFVNGLI
uniref:Uncharacterized protein n=1 Tax=Arundo donax TaxID=35708 RepID=A0A0A9F6D3_ARUDO